MIDCVKIIGNWKLFESWMRGNKRTFPKLFILHFDLPEFKFISLQNPRVKIIWPLPFKEMKRGLKMIWIPFWNISNLETLSNSMSSWGKIKLLLHIWRKRVGSFKEINWKSFWSYLKLIFHLKLFEIPYSNPIGSYLGLYSNYFSPKNK